MFVSVVSQRYRLAYTDLVTGLGQHSCRPVMTTTSQTPSLSPQLIIPPIIHSPASLPSIRDHRSSTGNSLFVPPMPGLESSASSVTNLDLNEGILVHDIDPEVDTTHSEDTTAVGQIDDVADEESRKNLRDHLRRTLSVQREKSGQFHFD